MSIAASYFRHKAVLSGGPIEISLESTAKCNLYCPMCPRSFYTFDNENMDLEVYRRIIQDCKDYVEFVWPYGIGEPMIHPSIFEMIRITREAGQASILVLPSAEMAEFSFNQPSAFPPLANAPRHMLEHWG